MHILPAYMYAKQPYDRNACQIHSDSIPPGSFWGLPHATRNVVIVCKGNRVTHCGQRYGGSASLVSCRKIVETPALKRLADQWNITVIRSAPGSFIAKLRLF